MELRITLSLVFIGVIGLFIFKTRTKLNKSIPSTQLRISLLPHYYKSIGLIIAILSFILTIILGITDTYNLKDFTQLGISFGLSVICLSKEKIEDEMIMELRMNTFFKSFYFNVFGLLILALLNKLVGGQLSDFTVDYAITILTATYLASFRHEKKLLANS